MKFVSKIVVLGTIICLTSPFSFATQKKAQTHSVKSTQSQKEFERLARDTIRSHQIIIDYFDSKLASLTEDLDAFEELQNDPEFSDFGPVPPSFQAHTAWLDQVQKTNGYVLGKVIDEFRGLATVYHLRFRIGPDKYKRAFTDRKGQVIDHKKLNWNGLIWGVKHFLHEAESYPNDFNQKRMEMDLYQAHASEIEDLDEMTRFLVKGRQSILQLEMEIDTMLAEHALHLINDVLSIASPRYFPQSDVRTFRELSQRRLALEKNWKRAQNKETLTLEEKRSYLTTISSFHSACTSESWFFCLRKSVRKCLQSASENALCDASEGASVWMQKLALKHLDELDHHETGAIEKETKSRIQDHPFRRGEAEPSGMETLGSDLVFKSQWQIRLGNAADTLLETDDEQGSLKQESMSLHQRRIKVKTKGQSVNLEDPKSATPKDATKEEEVDPKESGFTSASSALFTPKLKGQALQTYLDICDETQSDSAKNLGFDRVLNLLGRLGASVDLTRGKGSHTFVKISRKLYLPDEAGIPTLSGMLDDWGVENTHFAPVTLAKHSVLRAYQIKQLRDAFKRMGYETRIENLL